MQISTKVSTQVILTQDELKEAAIEFVKARTPVPSDATFVVDFADDQRGDLTAIIDITGTMLDTGGKSRSSRAEKPKTAVVNTAPAPATTPVEEKPNISSNPENRVDPGNQDEPENTAEEPLVDETGSAPQTPATTTPAAEVGSTPATGGPLKIFPNLHSSAPTPPKPEEDPTVKAKSLFANLTKPGA